MRKKIQYTKEEIDQQDAYCIASDYLTAFEVEKVFGCITRASMNEVVRRCKKVYKNINWSKRAVAMLASEIEREA